MATSAGLTDSAPALPQAFCDGGLARLVIAWQAAHGRHDLPWQSSRDPYRVWLSEIMLQQTQVVTVRSYFDRFVTRFPDVRALAAGTEAEVLALWSGLGYYSRARNLHRCAREVVELHDGVFPRRAAHLEALPGIGRSTAAAIAAFCFGERVAILDGNVRRVLARAIGFGLDLGLAANERALWERATELLPQHHLQDAMPRYTQGLMDLGATLCRARKPACLLCPLRGGCVAHRTGDPERLPVRLRRIARREFDWWLLVALDEQRRVWLERRPQPGIWAGLLCVPVFECGPALDRALAPAIAAGATAQPLLPTSHALTHRQLRLHPIVLRLPATGWPDAVIAPGQAASPIWLQAGEWVAASELHTHGLPAPIRKLLESLLNQWLIE